MRSVLKSLYHAMAILAITHLLVVAAGLVYLWVSGALAADRVHAIVAVLRGERLAPVGERPSTTTQPAATGTSQETLAREQLSEEGQRREIRRGLSELSNKRAAVSLVMQQALADKERFEKERAQQQTQERNRLQESQTRALRKTIAYLESVKPSEAKDLLLYGNTDEEAARILLELDTRKGTKIIEAGVKDPTTKARTQQVFKLVRELAPPGSPWLAASEPKAQK